MKKFRVQMLSVASAVVLAALFLTQSVHGAPARKSARPASTFITTSLRDVPKSELTEVYLVNNSKDKKITADVELTKEYVGVSLPNQTESVSVTLAPGEKAMVFHINRHYVRVKANVRSANFVN